MPFCGTSVTFRVLGYIMVIASHTFDALRRGVLLPAQSWPHCLLLWVTRLNQPLGECVSVGMPAEYPHRRYRLFCMQLCKCVGGT